MSDDPTATDDATSTDDGQDDAGQTTDTGKGSTDDGQLSDGGKAAIKAERQKAARLERELRQAQTRLKEIDERDMTAVQKAEKAVADAQREAADARKEALRLKVAVAKQVPDDLADLIRGDTEEEMTATADRLMKRITPTRPKPDRSQGSRSDGRATDMNTLIRQAAGRY